MSQSDLPQLEKKDFATDQEVRWCPGCGDYAILSAFQSAFAKLGIPREKLTVVSGIGCASRFPYYMNTYGFHTIHGRAPGIATGLKLANPDLSVWVISGDGDALAIGGNHLIHALRRNINIKIALFNNRIYGLTKGQSSPTSERGKRTVSTPLGSLDNPFNPLSIALAAGATFVARGVDRFGPHLQQIIERAAHHKGTAFIEIYQNCNIFNDGAYGPVTDKTGRKANVLYLEHGRPLKFGNEEEKGLVVGPNGLPQVVELAEIGDRALYVHDERAPNLGYPLNLAQLDLPDYPVPLGVLRCVESPTLDEAMVEQEQEAREQGGADLATLLRGPKSWRVEPS